LITDGGLWHDFLILPTDTPTGGSLAACKPGSALKKMQDGDGVNK